MRDIDILGKDRKIINKRDEAQLQDQLDKKSAQEILNNKRDKPLKWESVKKGLKRRDDE